MNESQEQEDIKAVWAWASSKKISMAAIKPVIEYGYTSLEALACLTANDIKKGDMPIGQQKLLLKAVAGLGDPIEGPSPATGSGEKTPPSQVPEPNGPGQSNVTVQNGASSNNTVPLEDAFSRRLAEQVIDGHSRGIQGLGVGQAQASQPNSAPVLGMFSWQDPQVYLKSIANVKSQCLNIVDFVDINYTTTETVVSSNEELEFVCRSGTKKPKLETLTISQWSSANIAILYKLHQDGVLALNEVFDYLSYTSHVYSLISSHEVVSVYLYDREYRRLQAAHKFRWGTAVGHLAHGFLRLRGTSSSHSNTQKPRVAYKAERQTYRQFQAQAPESKPTCRNFNSKDGCSFRGCRFNHVCHVPGCGKSHSGFNHNQLDSKN